MKHEPFTTAHFPEEIMIKTLPLNTTLIAVLYFSHWVSLSRHSAFTQEERRWGTWALGIQRGSGGEERVIGLRSAILSPDWTERCESEKRMRAEGARIQQQALRFSLCWLCQCSAHWRWKCDCSLKEYSFFLWDFLFFFFKSSVSRIMGENRRGVILTMPATWVAVLLCVITPVFAVEGRWDTSQCSVDAGWSLKINLCTYSS